MARKPMVTRTITTTNVTALCLNILTGEPQNITVTMARAEQNEKKLLNRVQELIDDDNIKAVHVVDITTDETLYGMSEDKFVSLAQILDSETRRPIEATTEA